MYDRVLNDLYKLSSGYLVENSFDFIYSVEAAIQRAALEPHQQARIIDCVIKRKLHGNAESFHVLVQLCKESGNYEDAYRLCKFALGKIYNNFLLYTDIIEISTCFENPLRYCGTYIEKVLGSDRMLWSLQLFRAVYRLFYILVENNLADGIVSDYYEKAHDIAKGMQKHFYGVEDGYWAEAKLYVLVGKRNEARRYLEDLINNPFDPERDSSRDLRCPKCCKLWLMEFKDFYSDATMTIGIVAKGLRESETEEDREFFSRLKEKLTRQLAYYEGNAETNGVLNTIKRDYFTDTGKYLDYFEKQEFREDSQWTKKR